MKDLATVVLNISEIILNRHGITLFLVIAFDMVWLLTVYKVNNVRISELRESYNKIIEGKDKEIEKMGQRLKHLEEHYILNHRISSKDFPTLTHQELKNIIGNKDA